MGRAGFQRRAPSGFVAPTVLYHNAAEKAIKKTPGLWAPLRVRVPSDQKSQRKKASCDAFFFV
jgi:hypothetical protein